MSAGCCQRLVRGLHADRSAPLTPIPLLPNIGAAEIAQ
jgi:hypothetical protein